MTRCMYI